MGRLKVDLKNCEEFKNSVAQYIQMLKPNIEHFGVSIYQKIQVFALLKDTMLLTFISESLFYTNFSGKGGFETNL